MKSQGSSTGLLYKKNQMSWLQRLLLLGKSKVGILILFSLVILLSFLKLVVSVSNDNSSVKLLTKTYQSSRPNYQVFHGIMLDAGSTGSRVHVYEFKKHSGKSAPELVKEFFHQVKPGLSSYASNPQEGAKSIEGLLILAKKQVPQHLWSSTYLSLKATAGLRLLPEAQANSLLDAVRDLFHQYPFKLPPNPVSILDGVDEGVYGWITVNYLLERLGTGNDQFTVGTIDLGGGSMQITFAPYEKETVTNALPGYTDDVTVFGSKMKVYTHSYLGLGLMSAREGILQTKAGSTEVKSPCFPSHYNGEWKNGQHKYVVKGEISTNRYEACQKLAQTMVSTKMPGHPHEIEHRSFYVFSYFFDRAADVGIIDKHAGGELTVQRFIDAAKNACLDSNFTANTPFLCMDMCLEASFLTDGFGLAPNTQLVSKKTINDKETSWTLGATFFMLN